MYFRALQDAKIVLEREMREKAQGEKTATFVNFGSELTVVAMAMGKASGRVDRDFGRFKGFRPSVSSSSVSLGRV